MDTEIDYELAGVMPTRGKGGSSMRSFNIGLVAAFALAAIAFTPPAFANHFSGGTSVVLCGDGEVSYSPIQLWPPRHKMQEITIKYIDSMDPDATAGDNDDDGESESLAINSISSDQDADEEDGGEGCGKRTEKQGSDVSFSTGAVTGSDPTVIATTAFVRAERCGKIKQPRTYTISVTCTSGANPNTIELPVTVPHDKRHANKVNDD
jgi:hypothetical protein